MESLFEGLGTMLIGLLIGGGAGGVIGWRVGIKSTRQSQRAGKNSNQVQIGHDGNSGNQR